MLTLTEIKLQVEKSYTFFFNKTKAQNKIKNFETKNENIKY